MSTLGEVLNALDRYERALHEAWFSKSGFGRNRDRINEELNEARTELANTIAQEGT